VGLVKVLRSRCRRFPVRPLNSTMSEKDINMDSFMRDTIRSLRIKRDKNFDSPKQSLVSTERKNFVSNERSSPLLISTRAELLGGDDSTIFPFKITANNENATFRVSGKGSSITDGTNGSSILINDLDEDIAISGDLYVVAEADVVGSDLDIASFTIKMTSESEEVVITEEDEEAAQSKLRLFIGKVYQESDIETGVLTTVVSQAVTNSYRTSFGFFNGTYVKLLEPAPTHPSSLD